MIPLLLVAIAFLLAIVDIIRSDGWALTRTPSRPSSPRPKLVMESIAVTLSSGRQVALMVPSDISQREALDIVSFIADGLGAELQRRKATPALEIVRAALPPA